MSKIDTQGMSGESTEGCTDNVYPKDENGNTIYPPFNPTPLPMIESFCLTIPLGNNDNLNVFEFITSV